MLTVAMTAGKPSFRGRAPADRRQMFRAGLASGLLLPRGTPPAPGASELVTEEAALIPAPGEVLRVEALVAEGDAVAQGQPLFRLRAAPRIMLVAPMAGRLARVELAPGRRLVQAVIFREGEGRHETRRPGDGARALVALMQGAGLWRRLRSRPFGKMPRPDEVPAAIFVMAADTRPAAPDPMHELAGREEAFGRGMAALAELSEVLFLCEGAGGGARLPAPAATRRITCGRLHPQGLAGVQVHRHHPARVDRPVWDLHAGDVADLGALLATGLLPRTRLVRVSGAALREGRLVRCQPGADLRGLCRDIVRPGPHEILSGSALDGVAANWLAPRDRQVTVRLPAARPARHWFGAALRRAGRPLPIIPTAALDQALGGLPAAMLARVLGAGDAEGAARLGALSLLEEDLALADYATGAEPRLSAQLRVLLDRIEAEEAPT